MQACKVLIALTLLQCCAAIYGSAAPPQPHITGGSTAHISKFPFEVSIRRRACASCSYEHYCSGVIYKPDVILTTANCVRTADVAHTHIVAGTSWRVGAAQDGHIYPVKEIQKHKDARIDIGLVRLALHIQINNFTTKPVKLADEMPRPGKMATVAGWGQVQEFDAYSEELKEVHVPIVAHDACANFYFWSDISDYELCAGYAHGGTGACQGDAGSPLLVDGKMVGLVSRGYGCARPGYPGIYTNVVQLSEWIKQNA